MKTHQHSLSYLLLIQVRQPFKRKIKSLGAVNFKKGYYLYVGSSPARTLGARLRRHISKRKKLFWHIDFLTTSKFCGVQEIYVFKCRECNLARCLESRGFTIAKEKFGSTDCHCPSHLFYLVHKRLFQDFLSKNQCTLTRTLCISVRILS